MRGFVMVLMVVDHASIFFNSGRVSEDSAASFVAGSPLPLDQFLTRWITHLCAPTFLFLAGTSLALSSDRRSNAGHTRWQIDRDLLLRGAIIVALDLVYMSTLAQHRLLQVLYAIGASMIAMVLLRRLPTSALLALALAWFACGEALTSLVWRGHERVDLWAALTVAPRSDQHTSIIYPFIPWLAMMMLGWVFGSHLVRRKQLGLGAPVRLLVGSGLASLAVFVVIRKAGGYGNMFLPAEDASLAQFLHVSKYPPALSYVTLELGLMALGLAGFMLLERRTKPSANGPLMVFGQTALFFYLVHFTVLGVAGAIFGGKAGLLRTYAVALAMLVALYPLCRAYRKYKQGHPESWVRFF